MMDFRSGLSGVDYAYNQQEFSSSAVMDVYDEDWGCRKTVKCLDTKKEKPVSPNTKILK